MNNLTADVLIYCGMLLLLVIVTFIKAMECFKD